MHEKVSRYEMDKAKVRGKVMKIWKGNSKKGMHKRWSRMNAGTNPDSEATGFFPVDSENYRR